MMGSASIINPTAAGNVNSMASRMARASSERNPSVCPFATKRDSKGKVTVPKATPNSPKGNCISRNAIDKPKMAPFPRAEANMELARTLTCVVPAGNHRRPHQQQNMARTPASRH